MSRFQRFVPAIILLGIFLSAFLVRVYNPIGRSPLWTDRTDEFLKDLKTRDWKGTYISRHPGVTAMLIGSIAKTAYYGLDGTRFQFTELKDTPIEAFYDWITPGVISRKGMSHAVGLVGLNFVISGIIVLSALVLKKISNWTVALTVGGILAFAPFFVSHSRDYHVDAILSSLMMLSGLLIVAYGEYRKRRYLLLSGFVAGWAVLAKSPALFMLPFAGLVLLVYLVLFFRAHWAEHEKGRAGWMLGELWRQLILPLIAFSVMMAIPFLFWPAMWVAPRRILTELFFLTGERVVNPHPGTRYLFGQLYSDQRPFPIFYLITFIFKNSYVTFVLLIMAILTYTVWRKRIKLPVKPVMFWLLFAYIGFFMIEMTIGAKQVARYILPSHVMAEVIAAIGAVATANLVGSALKQRAKLAYAIPVLAVALQAILPLVYAPDISAIHNHLLGGNPVAYQVIEISDMNEGAYQSAQYIAALNEEPQVVISNSSTREAFLRFLALDRSLVRQPPNPEFFVFLILDSQRQDHYDEWADYWLQLRHTQPLMVLRYDGVEYMSLYSREGLPPSQSTIVIERGGPIFVVLAWIWFLGLLSVSIWAVRRIRLEGVQAVADSAHAA